MYNGLNNSSNFFIKSKKLREHSKPKICNVRDSQANILTEPSSIIERWNEHVEGLNTKYDTISSEFLEREYGIEPEILEEEVKQVISDMAANNSLGGDKTSIELRQACYKNSYVQQNLEDPKVTGRMETFQLYFSTKGRLNDLVFE